MIGPSAITTRDQASLSQAASHFAAGRYGEAASIARDVAARAPSFGPVFKLLGSALLMEGDSAAAVIALREAARLLPGDGQTLSNLANALAALGQEEEAIDFHRKAIEVQPGRPTPLYNLGCVFLQLERKPEALDMFWTAYEAAPSDAEVARLCRELLVESGDMARAETFCRLNLRHLPRDAGALAMLGALLLNGGDAGTGEAEATLRAAVKLDPNDAISWSNLSVALRRNADLEAAIAAGQRSIALAPNWAPAHNNLGVALRDTGRWDEAAAILARALESDPEYADAYYNLGCVSADLGNHETAREALIEAVKRVARPSWVLQAAHACRQVADWDGAELLEGEFTRALTCGEALSGNGEDRPSPFAYLSTPGSDPITQRDVATWFAAQYANRSPLEPVQRTARRGPLRVGMLSSDFRDHATAHLLAGVLEAIDPDRMRLIAYDYGPPADDIYSRRLRGAIPDWVEIGGMSDLDAARRIRQDRVDIAIDLKGWTQGYRAGILAYRPAAVQMQWLGYPGTMGAPWIDYLIADSVVVPPGAEAGYVEKILRMPACYQPNDCSRVKGATPSRTALGLPERGFVLAAFHQPYKITRDTFALWMRLLARIPDAVLWLLEAPPMARAAMVASATDHGIDPARLLWGPRVEADMHLGRMAAADLALDAYPVNAHTTASDALWAGVPQLARCGETFVSRVSASVLNAAGLPELVARSDADYEALILGLASDRSNLAARRALLLAERQVGALFDTSAFACDLVHGLNMAWERWVAGLEADHLVVSR